MIKIGDFARLGNVSIKTLRLYDQLGLLKPLRIDRFSGYRYYRLEQMQRLYRILALKEMGFSLTQIGELLEQELSPRRLRELFDTKQAELQRRLADEQARLGRVANLLRQIEQEGQLSMAEVTIKALPEQTALSLAVQAASPEEFRIQSWQALATMQSWAGRLRLRLSGMWMVLGQVESMARRRLRGDVVLPLLDSPTHPLGLPAGEPLKLRRLPAQPALACTLQQGRPEDLHSAYARLYQWTKEHAFYTIDAPREVNLQMQPPPDSGNLLVELQLPVKPAQELIERLKSNPNRKETEMEPQIVERKAVTIVGLPYLGKNENNEIKSMWDVFNARWNEVPHADPQDNAYGLCTMPENAAEGEFEYVAAREVDMVADVPQGMVVRTVPAGKYAVFAHVGDLSTLGDTYNYIYKVWLPQSGMQVSGSHDFEYYGEEFKMGDPESRFYIYVPVK